MLSSFGFPCLDGGAVKLWWSVAGSGKYFTGFFNGAGGFNHSAEVSRIELTTQYGFVNLSQLGEGEGFAQKDVSDAAVFEFVAKATEGILDDLIVIDARLGNTSAQNHWTFSLSMARSASSAPTKAQ
jgi:hypothetical protein